MAHSIEFLETVYERMHQAKLIRSKVEFSTRMLGKGPSYLTSMSARDRNVSADVVVHLSQRIGNDINDMDIKTAELEEQLRHCRLEQAGRRETLEWIEDDSRNDPPTAGEETENRGLLARWLDIVRSGLSSSIQR